ncbi:MAG: hypothetical protein ACXQTE_05950 [Methanosarcinaceae archaeon]
MDISTIDILYTGAGLVTAAGVVLTAKYWEAKKYISLANTKIKDISEAVDAIDDALADDTVTEEEVRRIVAELRDLVQ